MYVNTNVAASSIIRYLPKRKYTAKMTSEAFIVDELKIPSCIFGKQYANESHEDNNYTRCKLQKFTRIFNATLRDGKIY